MSHSRCHTALSLETSKRGKVPGIRASLFSKVGSINTLPVGLSSSLFRPRNSPSHQQPWEHEAGTLRGAGPRAGSRGPLPTTLPPRPHVLLCFPALPRIWELKGRKEAKQKMQSLSQSWGSGWGGEGRGQGQGRTHRSLDCVLSFCSAPGSAPGQEANGRPPGPDREVGNPHSVCPSRRNRNLNTRMLPGDGA